MIKEVTIPTHLSFQFLEVWRIVERRDGCVFKTVKTGLFVRDGTILPSDYITCPLSTDLCKKERITIKVAEALDFG